MSSIQEVDENVRALRCIPDLLELLNIIACDLKKKLAGTSSHQQQPVSVSCWRSQSEHQLFALSLLSVAKCDWFAPHGSDDLLEKIFDVILIGGEFQALSSLIGVYSQTDHTSVLKLVAFCLEKFLTGSHLFHLCWQQCLVQPCNVVSGKPVFEPSVASLWESLVRILVSLPEKIINKLKIASSSIFYPTEYFAVLSRTILEVLKEIHKNISDSRDCSVVFISELFAKICVIGKAGTVYAVIMPSLKVWLGESPLWCRICARLFQHVPDHHLESALKPLLLCCDSPKLLCQLFGDAILTRPKLKLLFSHKFLLVAHFDEDFVAYCIVGYLASKATTESIFKQTLLKLLDVWGDRSSLKHVSYEQHSYITKSILISISFMSEQQRLAWKQDLLMRMMEGVPCHLESPVPKVRYLGMVLAECLTAALDKDGKKLNFELEENEETQYLKRLSCDPQAVIDFSCGGKLLRTVELPREINRRGSGGLPEHAVREDSSSQAGACTARIGSNAASVEQLDSDDELEPMNASDGEDDSSVAGVQPPVYLRDCISGLLASNDPSRTEACLKVVEKLVRREPGDLPDVAVELVKILLHMQDQYDLSEFYECRLRGMIAAAAKCPKQVVGYLTSEFYAENYHLQQRLDMLEVLEGAVKELSAPVDADPNSFRNHLPSGITRKRLLPERPEWRKIVDERIKAKTRRFASGGPKEILKPVVNKLSAVARDFFFPLVNNFTSKLNTCNFLGSDCMVLGKLVYTLGVVIQSSVGLSVIQPMSKSLVDFLWFLRLHKEAFVRQAVIFAASMVLIHCPGHFLMTQLQSEIFELRDWLAGVCENDPDRECRQLASGSLLLLQTMLKSELVGSG